MNITIVGAGAWGTAAAIWLSARHAVTLWGRDQNQTAAMGRTRHNERYLAGYALPATVAITSNLSVALQSADLLLCMVPTSALRATLSAIRPLRDDLPLVWACKGFEAGTGHLPHQVMAEAYPLAAPVAVLSGPSFAQEIAAGKPAALTLASGDATFAEHTAHALHSNRVRVYSSTDVTGVELGGALKNVMAIAAGISDGMALGHNARAALITRGLAEITRLGLKMGGQPKTFMGLAGLGDLVLTCTGELSRNRRVGLELAQGKPLDAILGELGHVAEGVGSAREVLKMAQALGVEMPITEAVCHVLHQHMRPDLAIEQLLSREPKHEYL